MGALESPTSGAESSEAAGSAMSLATSAAEGSPDASLYTAGRVHVGIVAIEKRVSRRRSIVQEEEIVFTITIHDQTVDATEPSRTSGCCSACRLNRN